MVHTLERLFCLVPQIEGQAVLVNSAGVRSGLPDVDVPE